MAALQPPVCEFGWKAKDFSLKGVDGEIHSLENVRGENGTLVMFICNHCPFVKSVIDRIVRDAKELESLGIKTVAIMSNDTEKYPEDSFDNMITFAQNNHFSFPYVIDETQEVAKLYNAICTPDFFGFNKDLELQYRGRLDPSRMEPIPDAPRELFDAMTLVAKTGKGPEKQIPSIGCSIKWKESI